MDRQHFPPIGEGDDARLPPEELIQKWYAVFKHVAKLMIRSKGRTDMTVTTMTHEALLKWLKNPPTPKDGQHVTALFCNHLNQVIIDRLRTENTIKRGAGKTFVPLPLDVFGPSLPPSSIDVEQIQRAFNALVETHGHRAHSAFVLRAIVGLTYAQTAGALGIPESDTAKLYRFASAFIRKFLTESPADSAYGESPPIGAQHDA